MVVELIHLLLHPRQYQAEPLIHVIGVTAQEQFYLRVLSSVLIVERLRKLEHCICVFDHDWKRIQQEDG